MTAAATVATVATVTAGAGAEMTESEIQSILGEMGSDEERAILESIMGQVDGVEGRKPNWVDLLFQKYHIGFGEYVGPWKDVMNQMTQEVDITGLPFKMSIINARLIDFGIYRTIVAISGKRPDGELVQDELIAIVERCIVGWNVTHPRTGEPLPPPSKDRTSLSRVPTMLVQTAVEIILKNMGGSADQQIPPPKGSKR